MPATLTIEMYPTESAISSKPDEPLADAFASQADARPPGSGSLAVSGQGSPGQARNHWRRAFGILVCLEVGIFLLVAPWSPLWTGNLLLDYYPGWQSLFGNHFLRGAVSGLGLLNLWFAFRGVWEFHTAGSTREFE